MSQITRYDTSSMLADIETLTGNTGGAVGPDGAGNVDVIGDGNIVTVTGAPGSNELTISLVNTAFATTQTVGNVTADLFILSVDASSAVIVQASIIAAKDDYSESWGGTLLGVARRAGAGVLESFENNTTGGDDAELDATFTVDGNNYVLRITGATGDTYNWRARISYLVENT